MKSSAFNAETIIKTNMNNLVIHHTSFIHFERHIGFSALNSNLLEILSCFKVHINISQGFLLLNKVPISIINKLKGLFRPEKRYFTVKTTKIIKYSMYTGIYSLVLIRIYIRINTRINIVYISL